MALEQPLQRAPRPAAASGCSCPVGLGSAPRWQAFKADARLSPQLRSSLIAPMQQLGTLASSLPCGAAPLFIRPFIPFAWQGLSSLRHASIQKARPLGLR